MSNYYYMDSPDVSWLSVVLFRGLLVLLAFVICELVAWLRRVKQEHLSQDLTHRHST